MFKYLMVAMNTKVNETKAVLKQKLYDGEKGWGTLGKESSKILSGKKLVSASHETFYGVYLVWGSFIA